MKGALQLELDILRPPNWIKFDLRLCCLVIAWCAHFDCRCKRSRVYPRTACPKLTAFQLDSLFFAVFFFSVSRQVATWAKYRDQGRQNPDPAGTYQALWFYEYESILAHALCCWSPLGKFYHWSKQASKQVHLPLRALQLYILYRICRHSTDPEWSDGTFVISLLGIYK